MSLDVAITPVIWVAPRTCIISSLAFRILLSHRCTLKSTVAATVDRSTLDVDPHWVFRCARLCQDICVSGSVEYYNWTFPFLTSFSQHVRAPIRQHYKVMMLQWPRRLWTVTSNQLWWSPHSCTDMQLWCGSPSNWIFFKQARNVPMGRRAESWKLQASPSPLTQHFMIQYLLVWRVHADIPFDALYSSQHHCDVPPYFRMTFTRQNIWQRGKINQYAPINAVKVAEKYKQHS